jgi:hypothetical protein
VKATITYFLVLAGELHNFTFSPSDFKIIKIISFWILSQAEIRESTLKITIIVAKKEKICLIRAYGMV